MTTAYRPEPKSNDPAYPMIWRPWMTRLGVVLLVVVPPAGESWGIAAACIRWPGKEGPPWLIMAAVIAATIHVIAVVVAIPVMMGTDALKPKPALQIAWWPVLYPWMYGARLIRWIATGESKASAGGPSR